MVRLLTFL